MLAILRPRTLQLYVLREFAIAFALALAACTLFMLLGIFFMKTSDYEEFGITLGQVAMLTPYLMPKALGLSVPPATMIAVATVFGRLSAENEILAAQAGGAPIRVMALPLLVCACFLSAFGLWCSQGGLRWGYSTIRSEVLKVDKLAFFESLDRPGNSITLKLESGGVARINWLPHDRDPKTGADRHPVHIAYFQNQEVARMVLAKHHVAKYHRGPTGEERILTLTLEDAQVLGERTRVVESKEARPELGDMKSFCGELMLEIKLPPPSQFITIGDSRGDRGWMENRETARAILGTF
ncbi:MAG: LptF/LptG family permease, partial [Planctomycetota bacterium]|nr:LptF/LptG family permease [Planctomycetota bacterium]